jgi:hydrogenase maturation factor
MSEVLPRVKNKVIVGEEVKGLLPLLNLNALASGAKGGTP